MNVFSGLSTSVSVRIPVAVSVPGVALATPPASPTEPAALPEITAASLMPLSATVNVSLAESAPSDTVMMKLSVVGAVSALIAFLIWVLKVSYQFG